MNHFRNRRIFHSSLLAASMVLAFNACQRAGEPADASADRMLATAADINDTAVESKTARFATIGDFGQDGQPLADVSDLIKSWDPEFILALGDNNYDNGAQSTIDQNIGKYFHEYIFNYHGSYGEGSPTQRFWAVIGNHEYVTAGAVPHLNYFDFPGNEHYYDFVRGPVHFFAISSDSHEPDGNTSTSKQALWLKDQLAL